MIEKTYNTRKAVAVVALCAVLFMTIGVPTSNYFSTHNSQAVETLSRLGSRGEEVRQIQTRLKSLGFYGGIVDGIYGNGTRRAVIGFQKEMGLVQDGIAGAKTLAALGIGAKVEEIKQIQRKLKELGFYGGLIDGIYGPGTRRAVIGFQKEMGLVQDGIAGPKTLAALGIGSAGAYNTNDLDLLARIISAEARGESYTGQVAVGAVVLNRVDHPSFPDTIAGVIYQPGAFDAVRDSNWGQAVVDSAKKAARDCMNGHDPSGGAIYYYNPAISTNKWIRSRPVTVTIGSHVFCK